MPTPNQLGGWWLVDVRGGEGGEGFRPGCAACSMQVRVLEQKDIWTSGRVHVMGEGGTGGRGWGGWGRLQHATAAAHPAWLDATMMRQ